MNLIAKKKFGQHFLHDIHVIEKITSQRPSDFDACFEIGPGPGVLTHRLKDLDPLYLFEIDHQFKEKIEGLATEIYWGDVLKVDWQQFCQDKKLTKVWVVSNLPYNISAPLMIKLFEVPELQHLTLMMQKEVAKKLLPNPHHKNTLSSLLCLGQNYFEIEGLCHVSPQAFSPPPKVDSEVLYFKRKNKPSVSVEAFHSWEKFLRLIFSSKRKQLQGLLKSSYPDFQMAFDQLGIDQNIRAEALSLEKVQELFKVLTC